MASPRAHMRVHTRTQRPAHAHDRTRRCTRARTRAGGAAPASAAGALPYELQPSEIASIAVADDDAGGPRLLVAGFGSLLSERSARSTFPELRGFRVGALPGFRRVFAHACDVFLDNGIADLATKEMSSLSVEPCAGATTVVSLFTIPATDADIAAFVAREHEFRFMAVTAMEADGVTVASAPAVVCAAYTDEEYRRVRCAPGEFEARYASRGIDRLWRDDVLPCRAYLRHCVLAADKLGPEVYDSFVDGTYLADRRTTVREWLAANPEIMTTLPPPALAVRYGG